jgi:hypothetical protein
MSQSLALTVVQPADEYSPSYDTASMLDSGRSYWCSKAHAPFPQTAVVALFPGPAWVEALVVDARVPGYESSAACEVGVLASTPENPAEWVPLVSIRTVLGAVNHQPLEKPMHISQLKLIIRSNHGGEYAAVSEFLALGTPDAQGVPGDHPLATGARVRARWDDGKEYGGRIKDFLGGRFLIAWDDGSKPTFVAACRLRPETPEVKAMTANFFPLGSQVLARSPSDGLQRPGRISQIEVARYQVTWENGTEPSWVIASDVSGPNGISNP